MSFGKNTDAWLDENVMPRRSSVAEMRRALRAIAMWQAGKFKDRPEGDWWDELAAIKRIAARALRGEQ